MRESVAVKAFLNGSETSKQKGSQAFLGEGCSLHKEWPVQTACRGG